MLRAKIRIRYTRSPGVALLNNCTINSRSISVSQTLSSSSTDKDSEKYVSYGLQNQLKSSRNAVNMQKPTWMSDGNTHSQLSENSEKKRHDFTQPFSKLRRIFDNSELMIVEDLTFLFRKDTGKKKYENRPVPGTLSSSYASNPLLGELIKKNHYLKVLVTVNTMLSEKIYLDTQEFCAIVNDTVPYRYVTFQIYSKYKDKKLIDITSLPKKTIEQILQSLHDNLAFKEFEELYSVYLNSFTDTSSRLQNLALSGYLTLENIEMATELFRQIAFTTNPNASINTHVLHSYLTKLYHTTNSVDRCYQDYRLWILKGLPTDTKTDAFVYKLLKKRGSTEQFDWIKQNLKQRGRNNHMDVLFVELCDKLSNPKFLKLFYENKDYYKWVRLIDDDYEILDKFHDRLLSIHLDLNDFAMVRQILIKTTHSSRTMYSRLFRISKKLAYSNPQILVAFIAKLLDSNPNHMVRFAPYYYELLWRSLITKYPYQSKLITEKFQKHLISITKSWSYSQSKILQVVDHPIYPNQYLDAHNVIFPPEEGQQNNGLSSLDQAERRFRKGIIPTEAQIFILLRSVHTPEELERVKILVKEGNIQWSEEFELELLKGNTGTMKSLMLSNKRQQENQSQASNRSTPRSELDCKLLLKYMSFNLSLNRTSSALKYAKQIMQNGIDTDVRLNIFIQLLFQYGFKAKDLQTIDKLMQNVETDSDLVINPLLLKGLSKIGEDFKQYILNTDTEGQFYDGDRMESYLRLYKSYIQFLDNIEKRVVKEVEAADAETDNTIKFLDQWIRVDDKLSGREDVQIDDSELEAITSEVRTLDQA